MTKEQSLGAARMLFRAYPLLRVTDDTVSLFAETFERMERQRALDIIRRLHATHRDRPPNLGHVIEACMTQDHGARITGEEAYVQLTRAAQRYGRSYGPEDPPPKLDPLIQQALGVWGSWNQFCDSADDDMAGRARFIALYDQLTQREAIGRVVATPPSRQLITPPRANQGPAKATLAVVHHMPEPRLNRKPTAEELAAFDEGAVS